jgi:phosphomannomutase
MFREYDIRGFVDQNFTEPVLGRLGGALGTFLAGDGEPGTVAVGRDVRLSSQRYAATFIEGLRNTGARVIDVGQVPTPLLYYAVNTLHTNGGGCITASHNPPQFNGLKARKREAGLPNGVPLRPSDIQDLFRLAQGGTFRQAGAGAHDHHDVVDDYVRYVATQIKLARPLKVVVDAGNGVAGPVAIQTFTALGCEVIPLYCEPDGTFPNHMPDPLKPENLRDLIAKVKETKADMGIALDGDGDRLGVVDDAGEILWADQYLVILARNALRTHPGGSVVFDVKCSQGLIDGITAAGGVPVGGGAIQIHQMNSNAFGFDYTFAMDNWNNISGIVVTNTFGYKMTNTNGYCPIYLEAGDKVVSINGINLLNEYSIQQAIQSAVQGMTVRFVNIRNGNWQTYYCQNGL